MSKSGGSGFAPQVVPEDAPETFVFCTSRGENKAFSANEKSYQLGKVASRSFRGQSNSLTYW